MNKLKYRLRDSTNPVDRQTAPIIEKQFPNFEYFWSSYLMPLTGIPDDNNWRDDTLPNLEEIGIGNFGVLKSINCIYLTKSGVQVGDGYQRFKNIYFHFGLIFDSVENMARNIVFIQNKLGIIDIKQKAMISKKDLISEYELWIDNKYEIYFDNMIKKGKPIFYYPQYNHNFISILIPRTDNRKYHRFVQEIKRYRNFFIHTPGVDIAIVYPSKRQFVIKKEYVEICRHWSIYRKLLIKQPELFETPVDVINNDLNETFSILNIIWKYFIDEMEKAYEHDKFNEIFRNYKREEIIL